MKKILFLTLALCFTATTAFGAGTIKIGLMAPLTGPWASEGQDMKQIVELLAEELNAQGGLLEKKVEIIICNSHPFCGILSSIFKSLGGSNGTLPQFS